MARFLSQEWVEEFNSALDGIVLPVPPDAGLASADGTFVVAEEVRGAPGGDLRVTLHVESGRLHLSRRLLDATDPQGDGTGDRADVIVALSYADAAALAGGELSAAEALTSGRIRVHGDLSVLVSAQSMLAAAREHTTGLSASTTY